MNYDTNKLAELLFPDVTGTVAELEEKYPERNLKEGARVTRFAPSPTGYLHIGGLFGALVDVLTARATGGVAYLRVEDTDKKREIDDGVSAIINGFNSFSIDFDEGVTGFNTEKGDYGPYTQSQRAEIYHIVAKELVQKGLAYPCFCTADELSQIRSEQEKGDALIWGYFGKWAKCRDLSLEEIEKNIQEGKPYVLRFRSDGQEDKRISFDDIIRGKIEMPENIIDEVLLKSDGIPTYHFAHACDDHFMRTTHVIRGEEWISSVPKHIALFKACGFKVPKYAHTPQVMKIDEEDGTKRKLSKRKDPEAAVSYFVEEGFPKESLIEYLLTLLNSNFEDWRRANPKADAFSFPFNLKKMSPSGCLFDLVKLNDVSKNVISVMNAEDVYSYIAEWAKKYDEDFFNVFTADPEKSKAMVNIDRESPKPRKDIAKWSEVKEYFSYMFDEFYAPAFELPENIQKEDAKAILESYLKVYSTEDDKDVWFSKIKDLCEPLGFTPNVKEYKKNPELFKGHVGDVSTVIRLAVTSRKNTPDLCSIMSLLGKEKIEARINNVLKSL
ncbi:MAG: glutamate--tRNA ligase [Ruminococcaceae bacterium]|nr:glutamate--tRNA ligase [Oscillospiraceae bacterium]